MQMFSNADLYYSYLNSFSASITCHEMTQLYLYVRVQVIMFLKIMTVNLVSHLRSVEAHLCRVQLEEGPEVLCHHFLL